MPSTRGGGVVSFAISRSRYEPGTATAFRIHFWLYSIAGTALQLDFQRPALASTMARLQAHIWRLERQRTYSRSRVHFGGLDDRMEKRQEQQDMVYVPLALPNSLPESVHTAIRIGVEPQLQDVHSMLATVIRRPTDDTPPRQLQLPIALVLLATVAGVSKILFYVPADGDRVRFVECLNRYFPWDIDPPTGVSAEGAANILYKVFRNPLVHALGLHGAGDPAVQFIKIFRGTDDPENGVEELERLKVKPYSEPCLVVTPERKILRVDPFYWGVRNLIERWSCDDTQVLHADRRLRK